MTPGRLILGDALTELQKLPENSFDVGITSPPYNKGERHKGWLVKNVVYEGVRDIKNEKEYQDEQVEVLNELYRVIKPGGSFFYNHKIRWERGVMIHPYSWVSRSKWVVRQEIIWNRRIAANIRGWRFWQVDERIYWLFKPIGDDLIGPELSSRHALLTSVWEIRPESENPHPAPFPIELPTRCIYSVLDGRHGAVIDPYAGSGTTLVAAELMGLSWLGIEISPHYIEMATARLANAEAERPRVEAEMALHRVTKTFKERKENGEWLGRFSGKNGNKNGLF
jgi:modification methylase